jgi:hypothetical protein
MNFLKNCRISLPAFLKSSTTVSDFFRNNTLLPVKNVKQAGDENMEFVNSKDQGFSRPPIFRIFRHDIKREFLDFPDA